MSLDDLVLIELHELARQAARAAGAIINAHAGTDVEVEGKDGGYSYASQVVTKVDRLAQDCIITELQVSMERYGIALLAEESEDDRSRLQQDYFWCIDPMDGTLAFIEQVDGYSVAISLIRRDGVPVIGVVYDPRHDIMYDARLGAGSFKNGEPWPLPKPDASQPLLFMADRSMQHHEHFEATCGKLQELAGTADCSGFRYIDGIGAAVNACMAADHANTVYFKYPKAEAGGGSFWDFAATTCIFNERHGQWVSDMSGQTLRLNKPETTFMNAEGVLYTSRQDLAEAVLAFFKAGLS